MSIKIQGLALAMALSITGVSCSSSSSSSTTSSTRTLTAFNTAGNTVSNLVLGTSESCTQYTRDTSSCQSSREALGLSGNWLDFSCNVVEGLADSSENSTTTYSDATYVTLTSPDLPDYTSNYYPTTGSYSFTAYDYTVTGTFDSLYASFSTPFPDPGSIGANSVTLYIPLNPTAASSESQEMSMGIVGMAINGVFIYDSLASTTDNIFAESGSFDQCGGHPAGTEYHYHSEPYSISYNDNNLIGVLRDGFFVYGRKDNDGTTPGSIANIEAAGTSNNIYIYGGHVGSDPLTGSGSTFHYHLTEWKGCYDESGTTKSADDGEIDDSLNSPSGSCSGSWIDAWFLTGRGNGGVFETDPSGLSGQSPAQSTPGIRYYYGTPGSCSKCT